MLRLLLDAIMHTAGADVPEQRCIASVLSSYTSLALKASVRIFVQLVRFIPNRSSANEIQSEQEFPESPSELGDLCMPLGSKSSWRCRSELYCKAFANEFSNGPVAVLTWLVNGQITHSGQEKQTLFAPVSVV